MKREKITYPKIKIINPLFWKECRFCGKEFKREKGYEIEDYTKVNKHLYLSYCCNECAKSIEDLKNIISKEQINFTLLRKNVNEDKESFSQKVIKY